MIKANISLTLVLLNKSFNANIVAVKAPERITFRLCILTHRCLNGSALAYLAENNACRSAGAEIYPK